jgi:hypothetical protein
MATPTQNQTKVETPLNVLHDQGTPNTLGGVGPPSPAVLPRLPVGVFVVAVVVIVIVLAILVGHSA